MDFKVSLLLSLLVFCCSCNNRSRNESQGLENSNTEANEQDYGSENLECSVNVLDDDSLAIFYRYKLDDGQERIFYQERIEGLFQLYSKIYHNTEPPIRVTTEYDRFHDGQDFFSDGAPSSYLYTISPDKKSVYVVANSWANSNGWTTNYQLFRIDCITLESELLVECAAIRATKDGFTVAQARLTNEAEAKCTADEIWVMHDENINWEGKVVSKSSNEYDYDEMEKKYHNPNTVFGEVQNFSVIE